MSWLKKIYWKVNNIIYKQPYTCRISRLVKIVNTSMEGCNKVAIHAELVDSEIGYGTFIGENSRIQQCKIGKYCACAAGLKILWGSHPLHTIASIHPALYSSAGQYGFTYVDKSMYEEFKYIIENGEKWRAIIENDVWIASEVKICPHVRIGDGAIVMAGAIVTKDVPPYAIVGGIPAKIIGYRFSKEQITALLQLQWWNRGEKWIREHVKYFDDVEHLIQIGQKEGLIKDEE